MKKDCNFRLKFNSTKHSVNSETYVQSLVSLTTIIREVNYQLGTGKKIGINIVAEEKGSFEVLLQLIDQSHLEQLFSRENAETLAHLATVTVGIIALKKYLNKSDLGKTEINGDKVEIKDTKGNVIYKTTKDVYNISTSNQAVNDAISEQFKALHQDRELEGLEIKADNKKVTIKHEDFASLSEKYLVPTADSEISTLAAKLVIVKVVFDDNDRKWDFLFNGVKISAWVKDKNFWKEINRGKSFSQGDELVADLQIKKDYDQSVDAYVNKDYSIVNVRQHYPRQYRKQTSIEDINSKIS